MVRENRKFLINSNSITTLYLHLGGVSEGLQNSKALLSLLLCTPYIGNFLLQATVHVLTISRYLTYSNNECCGINIHPFLDDTAAMLAISKDMDWFRFFLLPSQQHSTAEWNIEWVRNSSIPNTEYITITRPLLPTTSTVRADGPDYFIRANGRIMRSTLIRITFMSVRMTACPA